MKQFFFAVLMVFTTLGLAVPDAEARRLGGGGSFGKQSQSFSRSAPAQKSSQATNASRQSTAAGTPARAASPWKGMLGGALLGLGLGALLSQFGIGGALASMISTVLMIALLAFAVMFIYRLVTRGKAGAQRNQAAYAGYAPGATGEMARSRIPEIGSGLGASAQPAAFQGEQATAADGGAVSVPADFDVPGFVRSAKTYFIRLQAAWDRADVNDIREFTTPEMFAELKMQLQERGDSGNHTDVVSLDGELLGVETLGQDYLASVRFSGMIRESEDAPAEAFSEIWNLSKPVSGQSGWLLAGIQQLSSSQ